MRRLAAFTVMAQSAIALAACSPSYSPDTYASNAVQQANKVEEGTIAGVRPVQISAQGTVGGVAGAAAGGVAGSQLATGPTSAFTAIGGSLIGGMAGVATEHIVGDTNGFEYIVRKANGEMVSVAQKEAKPLRVGQKVLVISGPQARIVPDYTVPFDPPAKAAAKPASPAQPAAAEAHPATTDGAAPHPPPSPAPLVPAETVVPSQLPAAFGSSSTAPPPIIVPPATVEPLTVSPPTVSSPTVSPPAAAAQKSP